jgi:ABC-type dipeptide/oligopeptide/nickel transport system permease component
MIFQPQSVTPVIIKVVPPPTQELSVVNVIVDALGLTGLIAIAAMLVGAVFGIGLILFKRWREQHSPDNGSSGIRLDLSSR